MKQTILLTKTTAAQNEVALSYHKVRGLYFLGVVFVRSIFYFYILKILKKSEVVSYITLPCDQRGIVGYIMWEYDWFINKGDGTRGINMLTELDFCYTVKHHLHYDA